VVQVVPTNWKRTEYPFEFTPSATWHGLDRIRAVLQPFMGIGRNHAHFPSGGGMDFQSVEIAAESGCLSFSVDDRMVEIMKPSALTLEHFAVLLI
jgi:hypothetical protein